VVSTPGFFTVHPGFDAPHGTLGLVLAEHLLCAQCETPLYWRTSSQGFGSADISCGSGSRVLIICGSGLKGFKIFADPDPELDFCPNLVVFYVKKEKKSNKGLWIRI